MWDYLNDTFLDKVCFGPSTPVSNTVSYLVGRTRLRQIRIREGAGLLWLSVLHTCSWQSLVSGWVRADLLAAEDKDVRWVQASTQTASVEELETEPCNYFLDLKSRLNLSEECFGAEESRSYTENWETETTDEKITEWTYQSGSILDTLPIMGRLDTYSGGGYIIQLPRTLYMAQALIESVKYTKWIDGRTRVVFVEFTLFNPNVQLFTVVVLMFEYSNTGFVFPYHLIYTANFYHYQNEFETFVAIVEVLFVIYLFIFTYAELKKILKMKSLGYFNEPWTFVELTILCLGYSTIALFVKRLLVCNHLMNTFADNNFEKFANFHTAAFYDSLLRYVMSSLVMLVILKFFKLLRFNVRLSMLVQTLHSARGKLVSYCFSLFGCTMAFAIFAVLVFGTTLEGYRNIPRTVITMFLFMMGQSDYYSLYESNVVLGPLFFFLFSLTFQFLLVQYFITLLMDSFHATRIHIASIKTEVYMVQYIIRKFCLITMLDSLKKKKKL